MGWGSVEVRVPVRVAKTSKGRYSVRTPGGVKAKGTTKKKAEGQKRLLNAIDRGWRPTRRKKK